MSGKSESKRVALVRNTVVFQLKLMADGFRDLVLLPISLVAAMVGFLRGGDEPEREFNRVIDLGRSSEEWINLFGNHEATDHSHMATSIDTIFARLEDTLKQSYKVAGTSEGVKTEINNALRAAHKKVTQKRSAK